VDYITVEIHCVHVSMVRLLQILISLIGFIIGFGVYGPVSLYGVMAIEAAPTHLSGTSHAIVSFACNSKQQLTLSFFCVYNVVLMLSFGQ